jgi:methionyl-tRNA formyltransferase
MNKDLRLVVCGVQQYGVEIIEFLYLNDFKVSYIVTIDPKKAESLNVSGYVSYEEIAKKHSIPVYYAEKYTLKTENDLTFFKKNKFDLLIQGVWQRLFPDEVLKTLKTGAIGVHGSSELLPKGRGRSPINWSLIQGKKRFFIHYFLIKPGIDDGDIFHVDSFDINEWDDCNTLYLKNLILTKKILLKALPMLKSGHFKTIEQKGEPTYYPKRTPADGAINWDLTVFEIYNFIRALTKPYPGAFTFLNGKQVSIWKAQPFDTRIVYPEALTGEVVETFQNNQFVVNCNSGLLLVTVADFMPVKGAIFKTTI